ncbi:MAG TPA: STAS/SEC14 domain-containing protein [Steroidobacteraceae bacterium]|nr:STAS/SEC14 domain-containing protein [Steroidobacteraceae bacterium]
MIKLLDGFPDQVVACSCEGHVTREDYDEVLIPRVNAALARHAKVRLYYELGPAFRGIDAGAAWEDFKVGVESVARWERMAVVTDVAWIRLALGAFRLFMPGQLRLFAASQSSHARAWIQTD